MSQGLSQFLGSVVGQFGKLSYVTKNLGHTPCHKFEHYQSAISQGQASARNMLGRQQPYAAVHWFWSDQYEYNIQ